MNTKCKIAINQKIYAVPVKKYSALVEAADEYSKTIGRATPNSQPYIDILTDIEKTCKLVLILDNAFTY